VKTLLFSIYFCLAVLAFHPTALVAGGTLVDVAQPHEHVGVQTKSFLGGDSRSEFLQIILNDVHGLVGGRNVYISGSGRTIIQKTDRGIRLINRIYEFFLSRSEMDVLIKSLIENDFVTITPKFLSGDLDERKPAIIIVNPDGKRIRIEKWQREQNDRFDRILDRLLAVETRADDLTIVMKQDEIGVWEGLNFVPNGFSLE